MFNRIPDTSIIIKSEDIISVQIVGRVSQNHSILPPVKSNDYFTLETLKTVKFITRTSYKIKLPNEGKNPIREEIQDVSYIKETVILDQNLDDITSTDEYKSLDKNQMKKITPWINNYKKHLSLLEALEDIQLEIINNERESEKEGGAETELSKVMRSKLLRQQEALIESIEEDKGKHSSRLDNIKKILLKEEKIIFESNNSLELTAYLLDNNHINKEEYEKLEMKIVKFMDSVLEELN